MEVSNMSEKLISRRGAFSLLGLAAALALPTTVLTTSDAEAQAQPIAPAPTTPAPTTAQRPALNQCPVWNGVKNDAPRGAPVARSVVRRGAPVVRSDVKREEPLERSDVRHGAECTCSPPNP